MNNKNSGSRSAPGRDGPSRQGMDVRALSLHSGYSVSALNKMRVDGNGPPYVQIKPNGRVSYMPVDVDEWINANRRRSTSEACLHPLRVNRA